MQQLFIALSSFMTEMTKPYLVVDSLEEPKCEGTHARIIPGLLIAINQYKQLILMIHQIPNFTQIPSNSALSNNWQVFYQGALIECFYEVKVC